MTNERENNSVDELVSRTYRELADERTPEHLNSHVLRTAAKPDNSEAPKNSLQRLWTKPLAWAATIGLSLAIVLEITQIEEGLETYQAAPASIAPAMIGPEMIDDEKRAESVNDEFVPQDADIIQAAEDLASMRAGPNLQRPDVASDYRDNTRAFDLPASVPAAASTTLDPKMSVEEQEEADTIDACLPLSRKTADDWSKCIGELRESGKIEDADREYEAFVLEYPEFLPNR